MIDLRTARPLGTAVFLALAWASPLAAQGRSFDGSGNNIVHPHFGGASEPLMRCVPPAYSDGISAPAGAARKSARTISNIVCKQAAPRAASEPITSFVWQWAQFIEHDLGLTETSVPVEPFAVLVPPGDAWFDPLAAGGVTLPFSRSIWIGGSSSAEPRQQLNAVTAWLDGSMVYGSDTVRARALRVLGRSGELRVGPGNLLPLNAQELPNVPAPTPAFFLGGDVRANEQVGLSALHTLFLREHNKLCRMLQGRYPTLYGDALYEFARALVGAEIQAITLREWAPVVLGPGALAPYAGYDDTVDPALSNEFATAAFRFTTTMLPPELLRLAADGSSIPQGPLALRDAFFNPQAIVDQGGIDPILRGLATQRPQALDTEIVDDVRNFLNGAPGAGGSDLAALTIQRGRDHGLPGYNALRAELGLAPRLTFTAVTADAARRHRLAQAYPSPDAMDAWIGCLAEDAAPGALVGELTRTILIDQLRRLRDGDRYWYERMPEEIVIWVEQQTLATIIRRNTGIGSELQGNVFRP